VLVLVLGHLADEFGAVGAQASDSVVDAFDCKHDAPEAQRVRRCDRRFDLNQFWIAKLRQLEPPVPIWGPHHNDVDLNIFEPVDAVHPRALDRCLAFLRHAERGEKSDRGCKVVDDDADVVQSLDRHVPLIFFRSAYPTTSARLCRRSLSRMLRMWNLTVFSLRSRRLASLRFDVTPSTNSCRTSSSRTVSASGSVSDVFGSDCGLANSCRSLRARAGVSAGSPAAARS